MDESSSTLVIAGILSVTLAVINGALSAVSSVRWSALEKMSEEQNNQRAKKTLRLLEKKENLILSGLGAISLFLASATGISLFRWVYLQNIPSHQEKILILSGLIMIIAGICHSLPRYVARLNPETSVNILYPVIWFFTLFTFPISNFFSWIFSPFTKRLITDTSNNPRITEEEIIRIVEEGEQLGVLQAGEKEMIHSIIEFTDTIVREVMVPRVDMVGLDCTLTVADAVGIMSESGFSRIPVYRDSMDKIEGILYTKDVLPLMAQGKLNVPVLEVARKSPFFVPDKKPVNELLKEMQKRSISVAIVVDEYGGTDGLVTIEDILEEIVGEITDEYDEEMPAIIQKAPDTWSVEGATIIEDVNQELEIKVPADEHETISGFVFGCLGHIPEKGESLTLDNLGIDIEVEEIENQRILRLKIKKHPNPREDEEEGD